MPLFSSEFIGLAENVETGLDNQFGVEMDAPCPRGLMWNRAPKWFPVESGTLS